MGNYKILNLILKSNTIYTFVFGMMIPFILFLIGLEKNGILLQPNTITKYFPIYITSLLFLSVFIYLIYTSVCEITNQKRKEFAVMLGIVLLHLPFILMGPFLQPPSDPVYHSFVLVNSIFTDIYKDVPNRAFLNKGIYQLITKFFDLENWQIVYIDLLFYFHILSTTFLIVSAYISSRLYGLNYKWSFISTLMMVLFFGTDRFSFFTYYSLAPTSINMSVYWLLSALLFHSIVKPKMVHRTEFKKYIHRMLIGIFLVPLIFYNHKQEAGFLFFVYLLISIILFVRYINQNEFNRLPTVTFYAILCIILFLPIPFIYSVFGKLPFSLHIRINEAREHIYYYKTIWFFGKLNGPRILETLSIYGLIPLLFFTMYLFFNGLKNIKENFLAMIPGLLPFWIMLVPLNIFIWINTVKVNEHLWRMAYITQFWVSIAYIFQLYEQTFYLFLKRKIARRYYS